MELALYCPIHGYYEKQKDNVGRGGDFITSVSTGKLFGELLAYQFADWLEEEAGSQQPAVRIVEAGAHDGKLAADILGWLRAERPKLFDRLDYCLIEPSASRQEWQRKTLKTFSPRVRWFANLATMVVPEAVKSKPDPLRGIIFANELLDAFPVHRFGWDAPTRTWFEWGVAVDGDQFKWAKIQPAAGRSEGPAAEPGAASFQLPAALLEVLPDGYTVETSPAAERWWQEAAGVLERGKLMTIDYGFSDDEQISPARTHGTLRAYHRQRSSSDLLATPGEQDLTAHVNFSAMRKAGEAAGLKTDGFSTQAKFLTQILEKCTRDENFGGWPPARTRQFQTLTHPDHLGRAFRVLIQSR